MNKEKVQQSIKKWMKWVAALLIFRRDRAVIWSSFLSLNPAFKELLKSSGIKASKPQVARLSNLLSTGLLYLAISGSSSFPSDYGIIYIWSSYISELNPPSHSQILVSKTSPYFKLNYYNSPKLRYLYNNKHYIIFPVMFAQMLSNYLTPTKFKLNQRYLSSSIKSRILNPIWINFEMGYKTHKINWSGLLRNYLLHNLSFFAIYGALNFKKRVIDHYYELKHKVYNANKLKDFKSVFLNYLTFIFHKSNSITNFIYLPNLISILLISLTSPLIRYINNSTHKKTLFKSYIKSIGLVAGFITMVANSMDLIPDYNYNLTNYDEDNMDIHETSNIRRISDGFFNALNLYLIKLLVLQKWRILKENHPIFRYFKLKSWRTLENVVFCYGIFKLMNLNDFLKVTKGKDYGLKENSLIKAIDRIM
ncbi:hypothetical protein CLIB1444_13S02168 [[Candida] jaroonii]|uniref:Uncharacterized protein n=1 Tax=[Candida] jaroonii TaxID=467808 RepID=A0ACA9YDM0_9ASCO|nr:hypothetical protein CLIB1444_13S02168 [[Candida] jaroonii]